MADAAESVIDCGRWVLGMGMTTVNRINCQRSVGELQAADTAGFGHLREFRVLVGEFPRLAETPSVR